MPGLPTDNPPWPPPEVKAANEHYRRWAAWYSGDPEQLADVYGSALSTEDPKGYDSAQRSSLLRRWAQRWFWGQPRSQPNTLRQARLHIPLAGDIAATSADLLFGEMPKIRVESEAAGEGVASPTQKWLDQFADEGGLHAGLLEAAELAAAYGGVYLRLGWDEAVADHVLLDSITPDFAVPEWRSGRLWAVTFWRNLPTDDGQVWRHLERHERGAILHGLYRSGDADRLGMRMDLADQPETAPFAQLVDRTSGAVETGVPEALSVEYVPNMRPARTLRGTPLGRSDYDGIEPTMDAFDEAWTSWMRDLRIGKGRLVVPDQYMSSQGRGKGAVFDPEQEIFATVAAMPSNEGMDMQVVQFGIRVAEHMQTCVALHAAAVRSAGYSVSTFGEGSEVQATATEVVVRERRSYTTRGRKIGYWRPGAGRLLPTALAMQAHRFKTKGVAAGKVVVDWPDGVADDPERTGRVVGLLHAAEAASQYTRVKMANPDWDDKAIREEVDRLREDKKLEMPPVPEPGGGLRHEPAGGGGTGSGSGRPVPHRVGTAAR